MNLRSKLISLFILAVILLFVWLMIQNKSKKSYLYPDFGIDVPENYQSLGIDVSHYQGEINWAEVSAMTILDDSIGFAFIKLTEGTSLVDDQAMRNAEGATEEEILFGFYHFFRPSLDAKSQALFFCDQSKEFDYTLRPVIDIEITENYSSSRIVDSVYQFLEIVETELGNRPAIYTNESFFKDVFQNSYLKNEVYWIANYNGECEAMDLKNVFIWQFSDKGTVDGISSKVDLNVAKPSFKEVMVLEKIDR
ncbi:MAG: glycoside hydrolase family 25 protein [Crocinitomicaceae bacterium]|jgi:lysozyme|nr:glycoside hydrolase family 25 protein [Crocinitomicaceae bacterium]